MPITDDTDMEVYILGDIPSFIIEIYVPDDQKYSLTVDRENVSEIRRQLDKEHGVSQIGDVTITLKNEDSQYNVNDPDSIFYGQQVNQDWVRIKSGWGVDWGNDVETQFQGKLKLLTTTSDWRARMVLYDALADLRDAVIQEDVIGYTTSGLTISDTQVSGMNPLDILEYLIATAFEPVIQKWFNMDTLLEDALLEPVSLAAARAATEGMVIGETVWPVGSKLLDMCAGLMKMVGGYLYTDKNGRLNVYVYAPSQDAASALSAYSFVGDVTVKEPEALATKRDIDTSLIINQVTWKYGQESTEYTPEGDQDSIDTYGLKNLDLATGWEVSTANPDILDTAAARLMSRWSNPKNIPLYDLTLSWLRNGDGLAMDLGDIVSLTDPALSESDKYIEIHRIRVALEQQVTHATAYDATGLAGKFWFFSSEIDEGDGWGITGGTFAVNWLRRFLFFGEDDDMFNPGFDKDGNMNAKIDPTLPPIDDWGSGIESHFIFW